MRIHNGTTKRPPLIPSPRPVLATPYGQWASTSCESQQHGRFLTRHLRFSRQNNTWRGDYFNFHDALCTQPLYDIHVSGRFVRRGASRTNSDAVNFDFELERMAITPRDDQSMSMLNNYHGTSCGYPGEWMLAQPQDVTETAGCSILGLYVPEKKLQTLKLEVDYWGRRQLFVGELSNSLTMKYGLKPSRPTSFQPPLSECWSVMELTPTHSAVELQRRAQEREERERMKKKELPALRDEEATTKVRIGCGRAQSSVWVVVWGLLVVLVLGRT